MAKLHLITYGCQMNEYDSERVAGLLKQERYELTDRPEEADLILLNTCSIREKAEDKVYSQLGALRLLASTLPALLRRQGLDRLRRLEPPRPPWHSRATTCARSAR